MDESTLTLVVLGLGLVTVVAGVIATRPRPNAPMGEVRLLPWNSIMLVGMIAVVLGAVHLLTLWRGG
jgi:hypothetical protein